MFFAISGCRDVRLFNVSCVFNGKAGREIWNVNHETVFNKRQICCLRSDVRPGGNFFRNWDVGDCQGHAFAKD